MVYAKRRERSYFCASVDSKRIAGYIDALPMLTRVEFSNPVTETVYFTQGKQAKYATPHHTIVRIRKYSHDLSKSIEITSEEVFLELKTNHSETINTKRRILVPGTRVVALLSKIESSDDAETSRYLENLPPLFPTGAMQTVRSHWIHTSGMRITLDYNIRFFLFLKDRFVADLVKILNQGKIEFKYPKPGMEIVSAEDDVALNCKCSRQENEYLRRRAMECVLKS